MDPNVLAVILIVLAVGGALFYIARAKLRGEKCVGCPYAKQCGGHCQGGCSSPHKKDPPKGD